MIYAKVDILAALLLLLHEAGSEAATAGIDDVTTFLSLDGGVEAEILATGQAKAAEVLFVTQLLGAILHESLQFGQGLFDLGHCTGTVDKFPLLGIVLLVCDDERQ